MEDYNIEFEIDAESQKKYLTCLSRKAKMVINAFSSTPMDAGKKQSKINRSTSRNAGKKQSTINFS